ncbi:DUF4817 domain-containing protein [Trichonephila clavipes]|nr:DUF4817 domain-containing protein [Trichonephila clavipes]
MTCHAFPIGDGSGENTTRTSETRGSRPINDSKCPKSVCQDNITIFGEYAMLLKAAITSSHGSSVPSRAVIGKWKDCLRTNRQNFLLPVGCLLHCQVIYSQFGLAIHQTIIKKGVDSSNGPKTRLPFVPGFHKRILFSDEAHFWLNGYVNKQNCRIWSEANPQVYVETPLHPEKLTVWCTLWAGGIIGPYFFKNDEGHNVTVNGDRYRAMITNFSFLN